MEATGEWKHPSAGGGIDGPTWRNNPQYILTGLKGDQECTLTLKLEKKPSKETDGIGFAVFKSANASQPVMDVMANGELLLVHNTVQKKGLTEATYTWTVTAAEIPYAIVPYWGTKKSGKFSLATSVGSLALIKNAFVYQTVSAGWTLTTSGGPSTAPTFDTNENICLVLTQDTQVILVLSREATAGRYKGKIGCYIAKVDEIPTEKLKTAKWTHEPKFVNTREVVETFNLSAGLYIIIPATHETQHFASYSVSTYTDNPVKLTKLFGPDPQPVPIVEDKPGDSSLAPPAERQKIGRVHSSSRGSKDLAAPRIRTRATRTKSVGPRSQHTDMKGTDPVEKLERELEELVETKEAFEKAKKEWATKKQKMERDWKHKESKYKTIIEKLESEKLDLNEKLKAAQRQEMDSTSRINELIDQHNITKKRKNEREAELFAEIESLKAEIAAAKKIEEEEEQSIDWTLPINSEPQKGQQVIVRGEWKGESAGGSLNNHTWRWNPQIFLYVKKNTTINFSLFQPQGPDQLSINFYVFRTFSAQAKRLVKAYAEQDIVCESYFSTLKPSKVTKDTELPSSPYPYVIVPATFLPSAESQFAMLIKADSDIEAIYSDPLKHDWDITKGEWTKENAGGCPNSASFVTNPMYRFTLEQQTSIEFHLWQDQKPFDSVGLYVLQAPADQRTKLVAFNPAEDMRHSDFKNMNESSLAVNLPAGTYAVVPCAFSPQNLGSFQLRTLSASKIDLFSLPDPVFVSVRGTWGDGRAGGSINDPEEWIKNAQYLLTLKANEKLTVILEQTVKPNLFGIGWTLFSSDLKVSSPEAAPLVAKSVYKPSKRISDELQLSAGSYILVPTTFSPNEVTDFQVLVTSGNPALTENVSLQIL